MEYRKSVQLDANADYWVVTMGELNRLNGKSSWPFPSEAAAIAFADAHKALALSIHGVHRDISIQFPDGRTEKV